MYFAIREGVAADANVLLPLVERGARQLYSKLPSSNKLFVDKITKEYESLLAKPGHVLVALSPYGIVGTIYLCRGQGSGVWLGGLYTALRGFGIGHILNDHALLLAASNGYSIVKTETLDTNTIELRSLEERGYHRTGVRQDADFDDINWVELTINLLPGSLDPTAAKQRRKNNHGIIS